MVQKTFHCTFCNFPIDVDAGMSGGIALTGTLSENGEESDSDGDDDDSDNEPLEVTFEFKDPCEMFTSSIQMMLRNYPCQVDKRSLAAEISGQGQIGTVICQEGMSDVFGFVSALNLGPHRVSASVQVILCDKPEV
jgi:hypothetical protein